MNTPVNLGHHFAVRYHNKVMLSVFDSARLYHLDPQRQEDLEKDWSHIAWIRFSDQIKEMSADQIAHKFTEYGDFNIFKDDYNSCYIEFYYFDPATVQP